MKELNLVKIANALPSTFKYLTVDPSADGTVSHYELYSEEPYYDPEYECHYSDGGEIQYNTLREFYDLPILEPELEPRIFNLDEWRNNANNI